MVWEKPLEIDAHPLREPNRRSKWVMGASETKGGGEGEGTGNCQGRRLLVLPWRLTGRAPHAGSRMQTPFQINSRYVIVCAVLV